jgi:hypothetical protein
LLGVDLPHDVLHFQLRLLNLLLPTVLGTLDQLDRLGPLLLFSVRHIFKYAYPDS